MTKNSNKKSGQKPGILAFVSGLAMGAAAVFFSNKENREKTKKAAKNVKQQAEKKVKKAKKQVKKQVEQAKKTAKSKMKK